MLFLKTLRDLRASLAQTIALVVIVSLGVISLISLVSAYRDLGSSYNQTYDQLKFADATFAAQSLPAQAALDVGKIQGVMASAGRLVVDAGLDLPASVAGAQSVQIRARLIGVAPDQHPTVNDVLVLHGNYLRADAPSSVLVESHFAAYYHLQPGDKVTPIINGQVVTLTIAGIAASPEYLIVSPSKQDFMPSARTFAVIFIGLPELQRLTNAEGVINQVSVLLSPGSNSDIVVRNIQNTLGTYGVLDTTLQKDQPSNNALKQDLAGYSQIAIIMPLLILLVAAISVYVMLGRQVRAQRPTIGLMKALGYSNGAVMGHYLTYAMLIGVMGSALGALAGYPLASEITTEYAGELGIPLVQSRFYPDLLIAGVALSLLVCFLAGIGPARSVTRMVPAEAMRLDPVLAGESARPFFFEKWLPLWLRLPLRNVFRVWHRSLSTGLGIVFAFMLILMVVGMLDSMSSVLDSTYKTVERWDVVAQFSQPQDAATLSRLSAWPGVQSVEPTIQIPVTLKSNGRQSDILLTAFQPDQTLHYLVLKDGQTAAQALSENHVVLTAAMADKLGLKSGDKVMLQTPFGDHEVVLGGKVDELMNAAGYMPISDVQKWAGVTGVFFNGAYMKVDPARANSIKADLYALPGAYSVQLKADIQSDWRSLMGLFYVLMGVMLVFAVVMAFALLFNAMTISVLERQRELATMRAVGASRWGIAQLMIDENIVLWVITLIPGLVLGYLVALELGAEFSSDIFTFQVVIAPLSYVVTAAGVLLTMIVSALPAIRRVNHLNLAQATKVLT